MTRLYPYVLVPGSMADQPGALYHAMIAIKKYFDSHAEKDAGDKSTMNLREFMYMLRKDGDEVSKTYSQYCSFRLLEMHQSWVWCLFLRRPRPLMPCTRGTIFSSWRGTQPFTLCSSRGSAGALGVPAPAVLERPHGAILCVRGRG